MGGFDVWFLRMEERIVSMVTGLRVVSRNLEVLVEKLITEVSIPEIEGLPVEQDQILS